MLHTSAEEQGDGAIVRLVSRANLIATCSSLKPNAIEAQTARNGGDATIVPVDVAFGGKIGSIEVEKKYRRKTTQCINLNPSWMMNIGTKKFAIL